MCPCKGRISLGIKYPGEREGQSPSLWSARHRRVENNHAPIALSNSRLMM